MRKKITVIVLIALAIILGGYLFTFLVKSKFPFLFEWYSGSLITYCLLVIIYGIYSLINSYIND